MSRKEELQELRAVVNGDKLLDPSYSIPSSKDINGLPVKRIDYANLIELPYIDNFGNSCRTKEEMEANNRVWAEQNNGIVSEDNHKYTR